MTSSRLNEMMSASRAPNCLIITAVNARSNMVNRKILMNLMPRMVVTHSKGRNRHWLPCQ